MYGQAYVGSTTVTIGFLVWWAADNGDPFAVAILVAVWLICQALLRASTCGYRPIEPEPAGELVGPGLFDDVYVPGRPHACRRRRLPRPVRPAAHRGPDPVHYQPGA